MGCTRFVGTLKPLNAKQTTQHVATNSGSNTGVNSIMKTTQVPIMTTDTRYPYTYAADYVRILAGYRDYDPKLSRSDASLIYSGIALALAWMTLNWLLN